MRRIARNGLVPCLALAWGATVWGGEGRLTLEPSRGERVEAPISIPVPDSLAEGRYQLTPDGDSPAIPAVVVREADRSSLIFISPMIAKSTTYELSRAGDGSPTSGGVTFASKGENLEILVDGEQFGVHRVDAGAKPFLFPLRGPTGDPYTRAFPMEEVEGEKRDHPHQRSFWFTHGDVNGVDFWSEAKNHGTIKETARFVAASGPVMGRVKTRDDWVGPDGVKICEDERVLTVYDTRSVRILDFEITIKASEGPLVFGDTKEGTFGVRVATSMDVDRENGGKIRNADGLEDAEAWGKPSSWVDYSGPLGGETVGIAILNNPESFRYPTPWHVRTYGLFAANPFGLHDFGMEASGEHRLEKDESIWFGYRVILHADGVDAAKIADQFRAYVEPPNYELTPAE